ncbi:hypothetical protein NN3_37860 [Nocardia neocaledoniensis NBRC 108232]|uniref:Uncharacterized protein n=1 Tax=Nocardia neocaledoniensis TaxID=236511 RepID=A0A317NDG8_9NOCA|nr:SpaA isopeptide-forming pilin-related protein [Nocardia neocaledoniensis]PWV72847.1 hypothetical protein DFR69_108161 [Nocardia neocaledoniensis]GEM32779.1 hypothetical protein NN3_37860 [Nocardia neocaledoniensis NBRC 108232]
MRRTLLALSVLCPLVGAAAAAAEPVPPGAGTLSIHTFTGREPIPVNRADVAVTPCGAKQVIATVVSGADGRATTTLPAGCYEAVVAKVPGGCALADEAPVRVTVTVGKDAEAGFRFRCA